ncbi:MAG: hypothetical protein IPK79_09325 [Vampirovibrionales bacterium]|nr:hypothetical protein [Vampirovibrionales bacterium]
MPAVVAILLLFGLTYQLFFRYEHWVDRANSQIVYERDNLTGETHVAREGDKRGFLARLFGSRRDRLHGIDAPVNETDPVAMSLIEDRRPTQTLRLKKIEARSNFNADGTLARAPLPAAPTPDRAPPEPLNNMMIASSGEERKSPPLPVVDVQTRGLDINRDGVAEQIMYDRTANDGLMDISILVEHREVFYGRGKAIRVLPTGRNGWADVALMVNEQESRVFRYNPASSMYEARS